MCRRRHERMAPSDGMDPIAHDEKGGIVCEHVGRVLRVEGEREERLIALRVQRRLRAVRLFQVCESHIAVDDFDNIFPQRSYLRLLLVLLLLLSLLSTPLTGF